MNRAMRMVGVAVTIGLIAVSLMMNFRFGQSLGRTAWDGLVYGLASACADGFKVILPFAVMAAWRSQRRLAAALGSALWLVFTAYSMTSSLGHSAVNRAETVGERRAEMDGYRDVRRRLEMKIQERERVPAFRPLEAVQAELAAAQRQWQFERTSGCAGEERGARKFCEGVRALQAEEATARRARDLEAEIVVLKADLEKVSSAAKSEHSDAQTAILRQISGWGEEYVRLGLTLIVSVMVELGSGLGLYVILGHRAAALPSVAKADAPRLRVRWAGSSAEVKWFRERVAFAETSHVSEIELYRDYCIWVVQKDRGPAMTLSSFRHWLAEGQGLVPMRKRGRNYFEGVQLRSALIAAPERTIVAQEGDR